MDHATLEHEVDLNYEAFLRLQPELMREHADEHVLIRAGQMISFHPNASAALAAGRAAFADAVFSIQQVRNEPIDLGFYSHAVATRLA